MDRNYHESGVIMPVKLCSDQKRKIWFCEIDEKGYLEWIENVLNNVWTSILSTYVWEGVADYSYFISQISIKNVYLPNFRTRVITLLSHECN